MMEHDLGAEGSGLELVHVSEVLDYFGESNYLHGEEIV